MHMGSLTVQPATWGIYAGFVPFSKGVFLPRHPISSYQTHFWTTVNFEVEYFLNEETGGVLTDTVMYFYDQHLTWLSQLKPNVKVG